MNIMKKVAIGSALMTAFAAPAFADVIQNVHEAFASGGVFDGAVTFTDDFTQTIGVDGFLTGSSYGNDHIGWIWNPGVNFANAPGAGGNFLMDGSSTADYVHFISFTWNFTNAPSLVFSNVGYGNNVDYVDMGLGGTIENAVPEPATLALLGLGLLGFAASRRKRQGNEVSV